VLWPEKKLAVVIHTQITEKELTKRTKPQGLGPAVGKAREPTHY